MICINLVLMKRKIYLKELYITSLTLSLKFSDLYTVTSNSDLRFLNEVFKSDTVIKLEKLYAYHPQQRLINIKIK